MRARWLRTLIPAGIVSVVLAFSYLSPVGALDSVNQGQGHHGVGYNCGRFGFGYQHNGNPCPNRPFPGNPSPGP